MTDGAEPGDASPPTRHDDSGPPALDVRGGETLFRLGRYTVLQRLGSGGMGIVYAAHDDELARRVALKLLHVHRSGGSIGRARMQREAQALAKLSHPNVVQVYEVGGVDDRLYLVMEFLSGLTLRAWLKKQPRSWREIVAAYLQAGRGLAAAHRAGLVHRDFKPDNAIVDDEGRVRVLDFGLARVHEGEPEAEPISLSELAAAPQGLDSQGHSGPLTEAGTLLGTPAYMSPEQLLRRPADARSDQFSLCVALWEALYGARPFVGRGPAELVPRVLAGPGRPPRGPAPAAIGQALRRGLSARPEARFPSVDALLAALETAAQRGRRRLLAAGAATLLRAATAGGYALARGQEDAAVGRCDAAAALAGVWDEEVREGARAAVLATGVAYAGDAWAAASGRLDAYAGDLQGMLHRSCLARQAGAQSERALALQAACLERRRSGLAAAAAVLRRADAAAVERAVQAAAGLEPLARCGDLAALLAEAEQVPPPDDPERAEEVAALRRRLAEARAEQDAGHFARGREVASAVAAEAERLAYEPLLAEALHRLGALQSASAEYEAARATLQRAFALAEAARGDELAATVAVLLVNLHGLRLREFPAAMIWREVAEAKLRRVGDDGSQRVRLLHHTGAALVAVGRLSEGAAYHRQAMALAEQRRAEDPLYYISSLNLLATVLLEEGRLAEAEALLRQALQLRRQTLGPHHPEVGAVLHNLGNVLFSRNDIDGAIALFREALEIRERGLGPRHPAIADTLGGLGGMLTLRGREAEGLAMLERALAIEEEVRGADHLALVTPLNNLGNVLISTGDFDGAEAHLRRALAILEAHEQTTGPDAALILYNLGISAVERGDPRAAIEPLQRALALRERVYGPGHVEVGFAAGYLAQALLRLGRRAEAEEAALRAIQTLAAHPEASAELGRARLVQAELLWARPASRRAALALARQAEADLQGGSAEQASALREAQAWLRARGG